MYEVNKGGMLVCMKMVMNEGLWRVVYEGGGGCMYEGGEGSVCV
jgi:hypothetical protein